MSYVPYRIEKPTMESIRSAELRRFLEENVLAAGVRLLAERKRKRPDYPFPDTKFNPNTGEDYPPEQYNTIYTWFLGRGSEACSGHLTVLDTLFPSSEEREAARAMLEGFVRQQNEAILGILDANKGRIPFRVNRSLLGIDARGNQVTLSSDGCNASELFCAKALIAGGKPEEVEVGLRLFHRFVDSARANGYEDDTAGYGPNVHAEGPFMLASAVFKYLVGLVDQRERIAEWGDLAARLLHYVLERFYEPHDGRFYEYVDFNTGEKLTTFLPGHACELVGLGLQAALAFDSSASERARPSFEEAKRELPRILFIAYEKGYDHVHGGMYEAVDPRSGEIRNSDLPWWALPETMRATAYAMEVTEDRGTRQRLVEIFAIAANDYFANFLNPELHLFPFRTRNGETGAVKDHMPVLPEADPLYHTNLSIIDMLAVLDRLKD